MQGKEQGYAGSGGSTNTAPVFYSPGNLWASLGKNEEPSHSSPEYDFAVPDMAPATMRIMSFL